MVINRVLPLGYVAVHLTALPQSYLSDAAPGHLTIPKIAFPWLCGYPARYYTMVLLAIVTAHVGASSFTAYTGTGCSGNSEQLIDCGRSYISLRSGYSFTYNGQTAAVYNQPGCTGVAHAHFTSSEWVHPLRVAEHIHPELIIDGFPQP